MMNGDTVEWMLELIPSVCVVGMCYAVQMETPEALVLML